MVTVAIHTYMSPSLHTWFQYFWISILLTFRKILKFYKKRKYQKYGNPKITKSCKSTGRHVCMYQYMYVHVYECIYIYLLTYVWICLYVCVCINICMYMHISSCMHVCSMHVEYLSIHIQIHRHIHSYIYWITCIHECVYAARHAWICKHAYICV